MKVVAPSLLRLYSDALFPNAWPSDLPPPLFCSGHWLVATSTAQIQHHVSSLPLQVGFFSAFFSTLSTSHPLYPQSPIQGTFSAARRLL